jgi:hypothetical protein
VSSQAGQPLRKASITAIRSPSPGELITAENVTRLVGETDAQGDFVFDDLEPGRYSINAQRSGYVSGGQAIVLATGTVRVALKLAQGGLIAGRVVDDEGEPFRRARLTVYRKRYVNSRWVLMPSQSASTDDDGNFAIGGLPAGKQYLSAEDSQAAALSSAMTGARQTSQQQPAETYVTTYFPGVIDPASATGVEIAPGAEVRGIELRMKKFRTYAVRGKASSSGALSQGLLSIVPLGGDGLTTQPLLRNPARLNQDGAFEANRLAPGRYAIE